MKDTLRNLLGKYRKIRIKWLVALTTVAAVTCVVFGTLEFFHIALGLAVEWVCHECLSAVVAE